jgi:glycosyltransferase involved in cell wall biosynthesis
MFTIIVPTHDRPALLARTLRSLSAQTWSDFTVVVVSDSARYVAPYAELQALEGRYVYVLRSGSPGPAASRNMGQRLADATYLLFLDDDDSFEPQHLAVLAARLQEQPAPAAGVRLQGSARRPQCLATTRHQHGRGVPG